MIILKDIYLQNFMSISELSMSFEEDTIVAITGENGSGKSALLYAIAFAITEYRYGDSYKNYVKTGCETAHIELNAIFNGYPLHYNIDINGENKKRGQQAPTRRTVTYKDKTYLNSEYSQFVNEYDLNYIETLMFHFGNSAIIDARPSDRSDALKKIFQIGFDDIVNMFKDKQESLKEKNLETSVKINELNSRIFEKQNLLRTLSPEGLSHKKQQLCDIDSALLNIANVDESSINKYEEWLKDIDNNILSANNKIDSLMHNLNDDESQVKNLKAKIENLNIEELKNSSEKASRDVQEAHERKNKADKEASDLQYEIKSVRKDLSEIENQVAICKTGICHACGHTISPEYTNTLIEKQKNISKDLSEKTISYNNIKKRISTIDSNIKTEEFTLNRILLEIKEYKEATQSIAQCNQWIESIKKDLKDWNTSLEKLKRDRERILKEKEDLDKLKPLLKQRKDLESQKKILSENISKAESDIIRNEEKRKSNNLIEKQKEERDNSIKKLTEGQNEIALQMATTKESIDVFNTLFPNYILLQACKQLEDYINSIIQRMFPYMKVSLKIKGAGVNFYYLSESSESEWLSVKMASKAQKKILSMAYQIALAKMYGLSCLLLDEVDDAMSDENAKITYEFIAGLKDFQQIIFISHRKESLETIMNSDRDNIVMYKVSKGEYEQV